MLWWLRQENTCDHVCGDIRHSLVRIAAVVEFFARLAIVLGLKTRYAAALRIFFTIGAALIGHLYWTIPDAAQKVHQKIHFKDVAITGGLLFLFVRGAGPISIDRR